MTETSPVTEILDAVRDSLENRNRAKDQELVEFWADWFEQHARQLREVQGNGNGA